MLVVLCDLFHDARVNNTSVPLNIGFIGAYLKQEFPADVQVKLFKSTAKLSKWINENDSPFIIGFSNYSWNVRLNLHFMEMVRNKFPKTMIFQGGPHIRTDNVGIAEYLRKNSLVDFYVMLEGEFSTAELVEKFLMFGCKEELKSSQQLLPGVAYLSSGQLFYEQRLSSKFDIEKIPSPYLNGMMDEFLNDPDYVPLIETNRGCPFACTFCAWGISVLNKVRKFSTERVLEEIQYIAQRSQSPLWFFSDANFGMFERDIEIAYSIRTAVRNSDYFARININWAKNSSKFCTEISHILQNISEPLIAVQSTDADVLKAIKRANIKMTTMTDMVEQGWRDGVPMSTDVLAGLPAETYEKHVNTLREVFDIGFQYFNVGFIRMLPGSEMESEAHRQLYGLETKYRPIAGFSGVYDGVPICEYEESIVKTDKITFDEMMRIRTLHFLAWTLWNSGLGQPLLRYLHLKHQINPLDCIVTILESTDPIVLDVIESYFKAAKKEWFDSENDADKAFLSSVKCNKLPNTQKLDFYYLASILLNRRLAEALLAQICLISDDLILNELKDFCLERAVFLRDLRPVKVKKYSRGLRKALELVFASKNITHDECRFSIPQKQLNVFEQTLNNTAFCDSPENTVADMFQKNGRKLFYDFEFGESVLLAQAASDYDSFDYQNQMSAHSQSQS